MRYTKRHLNGSTAYGYMPCSCPAPTNTKSRAAISSSADPTRAVPLPRMTNHTSSTALCVKQPTCARGVLYYIIMGPWNIPIGIHSSRYF